jgi:hypothetical protein
LFRHHYVKTGSAVTGSLLGSKWPIREPDRSPRFSADVKSSLRGTSVHFLSTPSLFHVWAWAHPVAYPRLVLDFMVRKT